MSIRNRVLLLSALACALSGPASAAGYIKFEGVKGESGLKERPPQSASPTKADAVIMGLGVLQSLAASRKAARDAANQSAASEANQAPDIIIGAGPGGGPRMLLPAVQKGRVAAPDGQ